MIKQYFNFLSDDLSNEIIRKAEKNGAWQQSGFIYIHDGAIRPRDQSLRTDSEIWLERTRGLKNIRKVIEPKLRPLVKEHPLYLENNRDFYFYEMRVLRYEKDQFLSFHRDNKKIIHYKNDNFYGSKEKFTGNCTYRWLTICMYLSSHEGGELKFKDNSVYKTEKNSLILFPGCNDDFKHQSLPVTAGTKYVITSWVCC